MQIIDMFYRFARPAAGNPYEDAKDMLLVDNVDDWEFLEALFTAMYLELPEPKKQRKTFGIYGADSI